MPHYLTQPSRALRPCSTSLFAALACAAGAVSAQTGLEPGCVIGEPIVPPITFAYGNERPTIPGQIAGHPTSVLIDTASTVTMLYRPALEKLGIQVRSTETNYPGQEVLIANIPNLIVGPVSVKGYFPVVESTRESGVRLGANYLSRSDHEIWWAGKRVRFTSPKGCRKSFLATWDSNAHVVRFETDQLRKDLRAWFKVKVNGREVDTILDTAHPVTLMDLHTAARFGVSPQSPGAVEEDPIVSWRDKAQRVWRVPVADMTIGVYRVQNASIRIMDLTLSGEMMTLGADFLRNHRVLVSMSQRRLYITHLGGRSFSTPALEPETLETGCTERLCITASE